MEVSLRIVSQDCEACLEFSVRDTGVGISPADQEHIFQPFTQARIATTRRFGGTGLGLSISRSLAELMDGRIWVESEVRRGSTFHFTVRLPLAKELPTDFETPVAASTAPRAPLRVLLAEDNPANQKLAIYLLRGRGHLVDVAGDGVEAISLAEQNRYDVILMDVQIPGMDGLEATAAIRRRKAGRGSENRSRRIPIIAMTAGAREGDRERCLAVGMDAYISKPVQREELIEMVERLGAGTKAKGRPLRRRLAQQDEVHRP